MASTELSFLLEEAALSGLSPAKLAEIEAMADGVLGGKRFVPSEGKQTEAYFCEADILLYGGAGGSGKSAILIGLALNEHRRSLLLRREYVDLGGLTDEAIKFNGTRDGYNGSSPPKLRTEDGRLIDFGACAKPGDEAQWMGRAHDLIGFDEGAQFLESQVRFLMGWLRSSDSGQRCRVVIATNPPLTAQGEWLISFFAPWLDPAHPYPAKSGELRWFITTPDGEDMEVANNAQVEMGGRMLQPLSRCFISASIDDNPYLKDTNYRASLDALPEPLRSAIRDGNFMMSRKDDEWQVIPSDWIRQAQMRWTPKPPEGAKMTSVGVDPAQGGLDTTNLAETWNAWFSPVTQVPGKDTPTGSETAALVVKKRRDNAPVVVDVGGGYGGAVVLRLKDNGITHEPFNGASGSAARTRDGKLKFINRRAAAIWKFREALDPDQKGGSPIALPPDNELFGDLTALRFEIAKSGIKIVDKKEIRAVLGRSPGKGDSVIMAWNEGKYYNPAGSEKNGYGGGGVRTFPKVIMAYANRRQKRPA